jgi:twitching motility protein PilT
VSEDSLLGRLAIHYELITKDQLVEALSLQSRGGGRPLLGEILIEKGWISRARFEQLLDIQRKYQTRLLGQTQGGGATEGPAAAPGIGTHPIAIQSPDLVTDDGPGPLELETPPLPIATVPPTPPKPTFDPDDIESLLAYAAAVGASDLHVHAGSPLRIRLHGVLETLNDAIVTPSTSQLLIDRVLTPDQRHQLSVDGELDFSCSLPNVARYRVNAYRQHRGVDAVFRVIPPQPPTLTQLGLPLDLARFCNHHQGLVLITGPAGCGKSSTLAGLVRILNEERRDHVITIEDPVEHIHLSLRSVVNQRQVGVHTESFSRALRAALREDPDIIAVGELRDLETIALALTAAETGHLVLATLHTTNAIATINRIIGVFPPDQQNQIRTMVSESLRAVISQRLVPRADGAGRVPALEVLVGNRAVGNLIRESKTFQIRSIMQTGTSAGMRLLDVSLKELVDSGVITRETAIENAEDPKLFAAKGAN